METRPYNRGFVDVIVRTKDRPELLRRALDDVLAQTYDHWRVKVINDGGSPAEVDGLVASRAGGFRGRVDVIHNPSSLGMEAAANQGIRLGDAPYVAIHDDDDTWDRSFLDQATAWLDDHQESPAVAVRTEIVWERIEHGQVQELGREVFLPQLQQVTLADLLRFNTCVPISMLYRSSALRDAGMFDESLAVAGDWEANLRLAQAGQIGFLGERPLAFWHQRPGLSGDLGNSVIALSDAHRRADRFIRDRELRRAIVDHGSGQALYLTRFIDDRFDELNSRLDRLERVAGDTLFRRAKAVLRRLLREGKRR